MATSLLTPTSAAARSAAPARDIPLHLTAVIVGASSLLIGLIWDISWHRSIGRDTFWTPAHMMIYFGGTLAGLSCGARVLANSFWQRDAHQNDGVRIWKFFTGPIGGWICIWGAFAMLTSAPFDNWWHDAYGLDVQILSPPHVVLLCGLLGILIGAQVMAASAQNSEGSSTSRATVVAFSGGVLLTLAMIAITEHTFVQQMHTSHFYTVAGGVSALLLTAASRASKLRWPATIAALFYMAIMAAQLWLLPLFPATPKLGPIGHTVTQMVPLYFPLLLVVPAFAIDLVLRRMDTRNDWLTAIVLGAVTIIALVAAQWPFGALEATELGRHPFFGGGFGSYSDNAEHLIGPRIFWTEEGGLRGTLTGMLLFSIPVSIVTARIGLWWGAWLRQVKR